MNDELRSILPSTAFLSVLAVVALFLTLTRGWADDNRIHLPAAARIAVITILFQGAHFA